MAIGLIDLIKNNNELPSLPAVFIKVNEAIEDPKSSMRDIAEIISCDQSLSARLLRLANSAFFGFFSKVDTISQAVTIIGTKQLRDLILATSVIQVFKDISTDLVDIKSFWEHSIGCGIASRLLASYQNEINVEHFFVAGLLHDIGRLILYWKNPEQMKDILFRASENDKLLHQVEREVMGYNHAEVGGLLLRQWQLPGNLEDPVKYHHNPTRAPNYPIDSGIVHVADMIVNGMEMGTSGERIVPPLDEHSWKNIRLSPSILEPLSNQLNEQYSDTQDLFLK